MDAIGHYVSRFEALEGSLPQAPAFLAHARREAIERFADTGFPGPKDEEWRATSLAPVAAVAFDPGAGTATLSDADFERLVPRALRELGGARLVFVNGLLEPRFSSKGPLPAGLEVASLADLLAREPVRAEKLLVDLGDGGRGFRALNAAFFRDGALVTVRDGAQIEEPIHLVCLSVSNGTPTAAMPRSLVVLGANSRATLVETFGGGEGATLTDASTRIRLGDGAVLDHYRLQREDARAFHAGHTTVEQGRDSRYRSFSLADGAALGRHELEVRLGGEGASCSLDGLSLVGGKQLIDHHTFIDHAAPRCTSEQLYKGILDDQGRAVFLGRVLVRPGAQKTDAKQSNRNLLLTLQAQVNSKPQLEIHADDVKCTHGSAVGQLDREALFYLRARGIGEAEARAMLTEAFAGEVLARMPLAPVRELMQAALREWILGRGEEKATP